MTEGKALEDTMPVELVLQRELAYRRKLAKLHLKPDEFLKELIPLQVHASSPNSHILRHPNSSDSSGSKRKEPPSILQPLPLHQKHQSFHGNLMLGNTPTDHKSHFNLCNVVCSDEFNLEHHLSDQKDKAELDQLQFKERDGRELIPLEVQSSSFSSLNPSNSSGTQQKEQPVILQPSLVLQKHQAFHGNLMLDITPTDDSLHCKLCNVECSSEFNLEQHLSGQKHKARLLQFRENNDGEGLKKGSQRRRCCEVCKISCMNEDLLRLHLEGKKHKAKLQELELRRMTSDQGDIKVGGHKLYCELCQVWCIDECSFKQHVEGRKHRLQVLAP